MVRVEALWIYGGGSDKEAGGRGRGGVQHGPGFYGGLRDEGYRECYQKCLTACFTPAVVLCVSVVQLELAQV